MNIGIFTDTFSPQINGVSTSVLMLRKELTELGHKVYVCTNTCPKADPLSQGIYRLPSMPFVFLPEHRMTLVYPPSLLLKMRRLKLDIIHTQTEFPVGIFGKLVSEFYNIPMVHTYHTMYEDYVHYVANGNLITPKMATAYSRIFCNRANAVIAPTEKTSDYLMSIRIKRPIHVIPTGIDLSGFSGENIDPMQVNAKKDRLGILPGEPVILAVGRLGKEKNLDAVIRQMASLTAKRPDAKLVIVGDGPEREHLQGLARAYGIGKAVLFTGYVPWDEMPLFYQMADVFTTASTSETQGLTYIEAMASGLPAVVKEDRCIEKLIIPGKTGYRYDTDEQAVEMLSHVLSHPGETAEIAQNGRRSAMEFSSVRFSEAVLDLYTKVIGETSGGGKRFVPLRQIFRRIVK